MGPAQDICFPCGERLGRRRPDLCTFHVGRCAWCEQENLSVTSATDFGLWAPEDRK